MASIPKRVTDRLTAGIKRFQPVLSAAKSRDVNESDTAIIVTDMLSDIFGYEKYSEITSEFAIRGTSCDLAIKLEGEVEALIEVKAIGIDPKDNHLKQAVDYAANQGVDWVVLTNGTLWRIYKVCFTKPIDQELVAEFDLLTINPKVDHDLGTLFLFSKEGWTKSVLEDYHSQKQALSRFTIGAMTLSEPVLNVIRKELRKLSPDVRIDAEQIKTVLTHEVLKREVLEGEKADDARRKVQRLNRPARVAETEAAPTIHPIMEVSSAPLAVAQPPVAQEILEQRPSV
jgi:hypothetical protein